MSNIRESATQKDLLRNVQFVPVFDQDGNIIDLNELKVPTDRRNGMEAMRELFTTNEPGDDLVGADGWTGKQRRILRQRAPMAAHYLKPSQKWDAKTGAMRDGVLIQLPYEVVWTLFELMFEGQFSLHIRDIVFESEEINPLGTDHRGEKADDAPGRLFYARATVQLELHLGNGQKPRLYDGVGVSYGDVPVERTGNIYAINNARRTAEKGAVVDAKREAMSQIGPVFRRAFEDGDDMIEHIERLLLDEIRERNKPAIHRGHAKKDVPAPARKAAPTDDAPASEKDVPAPTRKVAAAEAGKDVSAPASKAASTKASKGAPAPARKAASTEANKETPTPARKTVSVKAGKDIPAPVRKGQAPKVAEKTAEKADRVAFHLPGAPDRLIDGSSLPGSLVDIIFETCSSPDEAKVILEMNSDIVATIKDRTEINAAIASLGEAGEEDMNDEIPDFDLPSADDNDVSDDATSEADAEPETPVEQDEASAQAPVVDPAGKSGKTILGELSELLNAAGSTVEKDAIIEANGAAMRKLTPKQMTRLTEVRLAAAS